MKVDFRVVEWAQPRGRENNFGAVSVLGIPVRHVDRATRDDMVSRTDRPNGETDEGHGDWQGDH